MFRGSGLPKCGYEAVKKGKSKLYTVRGVKQYWEVSQVNTTYIDIQSLDEKLNICLNMLTLRR